MEGAEGDADSRDVAPARTEHGQAASVSRVLGIVARNRALLRVQLAFATFNCGEWASWLAMLVYAYAQGGVTESGVVATVMLVPAAVLAPVVAGIGERRPPGRALLAGYVAQATTCGAVAVALFADARPLITYALMAGPAVAFTMTRPTQSAFAPGLARSPEELTATNVVSGWIESLSTLVAPVIAGALLALSTPGLVFAAMGAVCALGALLIAPLRDALPAASPSQHEDDSGVGVGGGIAFVRSDPQARLLVALLAAQCIAIGALDVLYVELAQGVLHLGGAWAGYLCAAFGAGGVVAVAVTARLVGLTRLALPLAFSLGVWSIAFVGLAALPGVAGALALLSVAGGARATFDVAGRTLLQRVARPDLLARVFGLLEGLQMTGFAIGSLLAPILVGLGGASLAFAAVGAILPLIGLLAARQLLDIDRHATVPVVEIALLRSTPLFAALSPPTLESLARALVRVSPPAGTEVIRQGDEGDRFYVIADGEVEVIADGRLVTTLQRGDYFGEIALMYDVRRTATVRTKGGVALYALEREAFLVAITGHVSARTFAQDVVDQRLEELRALRHVELEEQSSAALAETRARQDSPF